MENMQPQMNVAPSAAAPHQSVAVGQPVQTVVFGIPVADDAKAPLVRKVVIISIIMTVSVSLCQKAQQ